MKPLFTVHAGEYLVGAHTERRLKRLNVWIPSRDTGIDLLVSDRSNRRSVSLQVKLSKDYLVTHMRPAFQKQLRACGWWTINRDKLRTSPADFWVFVLLGFDRRTIDFVIVPLPELWKRLRLIHGQQKKTIQTYLWVTEEHKCWEARELEDGVGDQHKIVEGQYEHRVRDFTVFLDNWRQVTARLGS
jgi:hypothetical protein